MSTDVDQSGAAVSCPDDDAVERRYRENLATLEECAPDVAARVAVMDGAVSRVLGSVADGNLNIDLGHTNFYDRDARTFATMQVRKWSKKPWRINAMPNVMTMDIDAKSERGKNYISSRAMVALREEISKTGVADLLPRVDKDAGYLIILGLGLGFHVERLIADLKVRNVLVIEEYAEFVHHTMRLHDVTAWRKILEDRGGTLSLVITDNFAFAVHRVREFMRGRSFGMIDGCYIYRHYQSPFIRDVVDELSSTMSSVVVSAGFFEDEILMMKQAIANLRRHEYRLFNNHPMHEKSTPVIVAGSGPSLDHNIDFIREYAGRAILISCGTALGALLNYGIRPDFHTEIENTLGVYELMRDLAERESLEGIRLICPFTVHPDLPTLFDADRFFYFRDSVSPSQYFAGSEDHVFLAAPSVTNLALRFALICGFREIYLAGVDFGSRDPGRHHSVKSIYMTEDNFIEDNPEYHSAVKFPQKQFGNFGGIVHTNGIFSNCVNFMNNLMSLYPLAKVYNLSDGVEIQGSIPKLPRCARPECDARVRTRELELLLREMEPHDGKAVANNSDLEEMERRLLAFTENAGAMFRDFDARDVDMWRLSDETEKLLQFAPDDRIDQVINSFFRGTLMSLLQVNYATIRRLPKGKRRRILRAFLDYQAREMDILADQLRDMFGDLRKEHDQ